jgi:hypothetical protein
VKALEGKMTYEEIKEAWNKDADEFNQWCNLSEDEKTEFAYKLGLDDRTIIILHEGNTKCLK